MTEILSIGAALSNVTGMQLRIVHSILFSIQSKELITIKAKSHFSKEENDFFFHKLVSEAKKQNNITDSVLQLDILIALAKALKLPAARLNEKEKVLARSEEIVNKWFQKTVKKDKTLEEKFEKSFLTNKLEFLLHYEGVRLMEGYLKSEKTDEEKKPLYNCVEQYWNQLPQYKKVQIYEHLQVEPESSFEYILSEIGMFSLLFEMATRAGFSIYRDIFPSSQNSLQGELPAYSWVLHPNALLSSEAAIKFLLTGHWALPGAILFLYLSGEHEKAENDVSLISNEWNIREESYRLLLRRINELKIKQQEMEREIELIRLELENAVSAEKRARAVYHNLRERLIAILKTDEARPYLGDLSVSNTRIREKLARVEEKIEANKMKQGFFQAASSWLLNTYLQTEKNSLQKKLQASFEAMADEVMEKYPYYEEHLIDEMSAARVTTNGWEFESARLKKKETEALNTLSDLKGEELNLREQASEAAVKTPGLKHLAFEDGYKESPNT